MDRVGASAVAVQVSAGGRDTAMVALESTGK